MSELLPQQKTAIHTKTSKWAKMPLDSPELYINRELSQVKFMHRVLAQAQDPNVPLLERLRFLTICSSLLDEFFEIRVAGIKQQIRLDLPAPGPDGMTPREVLEKIHIEVSQLVLNQYNELNKVLLPELADQGIRLLRRTSLDASQKSWISLSFR